mgnify:CR=1 FL=1
MSKGNQPSIFILGLSFGVILYLLNIIFGFFVASSYLGVNQNSLLMLPPYISSLTLITTGFLFVLGYAVFSKSLPGRGWQKGLQFAFWIWLVGAVPAFLTVLVSINVPLETVLTWLSLRLVAYALLGILLGWIYR